MRMPFATTLPLLGLLSYGIHAQAVNPDLVREVSAVRAELVRNRAALSQYTWTALTEVSVKGNVKSSTEYKYHYDQNGQLRRTSIGTGKQMEEGNAVSKLPKKRREADMNDYVERAISRIYKYVPPDPEQIDALLKNGSASLGPSAGGTSEIRFTNYFEMGDTYAFTYDSASKALLKANVVSSLGDAKNPVTLEALFEKLPDGVNHVSSATLNAKAKKVQVKVKNRSYEKLPN